MTEQAIALDSKRRIHLGILRSEMRGRSYEHFFRWDMDPLPLHVERALELGEVEARKALPRAEINRLLEPGYLECETGYARFPDGTVSVAALTEFPGATGEMIDWWFGWHVVETERYKLWHPQAHLYTQPRYLRASIPALTDRKRYVGNVSYVDEYVGPEIQRLAIQFLAPRDFGFAEESFEQAGVSTAVCARVGFSGRPIDMGYLVHLIRETEAGCEMRSRFWLGDLHVRPLARGNLVDRLLDSASLRRKLIPARLGRDLLVHCAEEMNHLASFLRELFSQEAAQPRDPRH